MKRMKAHLELGVNTEGFSSVQQTAMVCLPCARSCGGGRSEKMNEIVNLVSRNSSSKNQTHVKNSNIQSSSGTKKKKMDIARI